MCEHLCQTSQDCHAVVLAFTKREIRRRQNVSDKIFVGHLAIDSVLYDFMINEALPQTGISLERFWNGFEKTVQSLAPLNKALLDKRDAFQSTLDAWYKARRGTSLSFEEHHAFLRSIDYLLTPPSPSSITPLHVDPEIAHCAAPQSVSYTHLTLPTKRIV